MKALTLTLALLLLAVSAAAQTATIDPSTSHQTWHGFEARGVVGNNSPIVSPNWRNWNATIIANAVDVGVNRLRIEIVAGVENDQDYYANFVNNPNSTTSAAFGAARYAPTNDNADPDVLNPAGFHWGNLDNGMEASALPLRRALAARGEKLWINVCFVDFGNNSFDHQANPNDYGELVLALFQYMQSQYGFVPDSYELLLEPDSGPDTWTAAQLSDASAAARTRLLAAGFTPYFVGPSTTVGPDAVSFYQAMETHDANGVAAIGELSWHEYVHNDNAGLTSIASFAAGEGVSTAMLEFIGLSYGNAVDYTGSDDSLGIFQLLKFGKASSLAQFSLLSADLTDNGGKLFMGNPANDAVTEGARTRFFRQFFKYMRRGAVRKGSSTTNTDWDCLPFINPGGNWNVPCRLLANGGTRTVAGLPNGTYHINYSTTSAISTALSDVTVSGGAPTFTVTMPAAGVATIWQDAPGPFYASTTGSGTTCSLASPCSLATAASGASGTIKPGSVVYVRGGTTYQTKLTISVDGTADAPIVFRSYPAEWAVIDGYVTSTLATSSINTSVTSFDLVDASKFVVGQKLTFHDQATESAEEIMLIGGISSNTVTVTRAWDGTTAKSHTAGALAILGGSNVTLSGDHLWFMDMEVRNSDPVRTWDNANGQASPHQRGSLLDTGTGNSIVGVVGHNMDGGLFSGAGATDEVLAECMFINNGYMDSNGVAGHNWYIQNDAPSFKSFLGNHSLFALSLAFQEESVSGNTENVVNSGNIIAGNSALIGAAAGNVDNIVFSRNYGYFPTGTGMRFGYAGTNGSLYSRDNYLQANAGSIAEYTDWSALTSFYNTFVTTGTGATTVGPYIKQPGSTSYVWDFNRYYDTTTQQNCTGGNARAVLEYNTTTGNCGSTLKFSEWLSNTTFDDNTTALGGSTPSDHNGYFFTETGAPEKVIVDTSIFEANRLNITVFNPAGASSVSFDPTATLTSIYGNKLASGFQYAIYSSEDPVGTAVATGTWTSGSITVPMNGTTVNTRVGLTTPTTKRPYFGSFILRSPMPAPAAPAAPVPRIRFFGTVKHKGRTIFR